MPYWKGIVFIAGIFLVAALGEAAEIQKRGTMECDLTEATPLVYQGTLYRFEYVRDNYKHNPAGQACFRLVDLASGETTTPFALGYHLGSAYVEGKRIYVYGVPKWGAERIQVFWSDDLKTWQEQEALQLPGWTIYNTSVCKDPQGYAMAIEIGDPAEVVGNGFTMYFAKSEDARTWKLASRDCVYTKERYSACPALRFYDGWFYMVYLEHLSPRWYFAPYIVRSRDLIAWESSTRNPLIEPDAADKKIANAKLTEEERKHIAEAEDINNSDVDFCEFEGKTTIYYSWGNQKGIEFLAEASYDGTERAFLEGYFPKATQKP